MRKYNPITATLAGLFDRGKRKSKLPPLRDGERLDGQRALVTGASNGLGFSIAKALAERGAHVTMVCRSRIPEAGEAVKAATGNDAVAMVRADLADLDSIKACCEELAVRGEPFDVAVFNAGVMPRQTRLTAHGVDEMLQVNFLAKVAQLRHLLGTGVIPNRALLHAGEGGTDEVELPTRRPRIIFVSSESHRNSRPFSPDGLFDVVDYGMRTGMAEYAYSKMLLNTWAAELARRLAPGGVPEVAVHYLCPGAVATKIAREAPWWVKPVLGPVMKVFFLAPDKAALPVAYLACAEALEGETGVYLHTTSRSEPRDDTLDPANGRALWDAAEALLDEHEQRQAGEAAAA